MSEAEEKGWRDISSAPKDGTVIRLTWMEHGETQEIWHMQWAHIQRNGLFPGKSGMWVTPCGGLTWYAGNADGAPTHWQPLKPPLDTEETG